jgi:hypothetical protein
VRDKLGVGWMTGSGGCACFLTLGIYIIIYLSRYVDKIPISQQKQQLTNQCNKQNRRQSRSQQSTSVAAKFSRVTMKRGPQVAGGWPSASFRLLKLGVRASTTASCCSPHVPALLGLLQGRFHGHVLGRMAASQPYLTITTVITYYY